MLTDALCLRHLCSYAKLKKTSYTVVSEKLGDDNYSVTYKFPSAEILADFQKWYVALCVVGNMLMLPMPLA